MLLTVRCVLTRAGRFGKVHVVSGTARRHFNGGTVTKAGQEGLGKEQGQCKWER